MAQRDLYEILGVPRESDASAIRKAYRKLARVHHPDVNPNDPKAEDRFKEISYAYEMLSDERRRKLYDEFGEEGLAEGFDPERAREYLRWQERARRSPMHESFRTSGGLEDLLSNLFGQGAGPRGPQRGADAVGDVEVDLLDAVLGREVRVEIAGSGALRIRVPAGATEGTRIRLAGQGQPGAEGGAQGDLYLRLHIRPHPLYERRGDDLEFDLPVTVPELVRGAEIQVPTPDGPVSLRVPAHSRHGQKLRLRGRGAFRRGSDERGDLYARLQVLLPDTSDPRMQELAERMEVLYSGDPRSALRSAT